MSFRATLLRRSSTVVFLLGLAALQSAWGQAANAPINFANQEPITTTLVSAPNLGSVGGGGGSGDSGNWLKVEFHYNTTDVVTKDYPFVDDVQFKVWIEGLDQYAPNPNAAGGKGVAVALTGTVDYINVGVNKDLYGVFYVHPSVLARYGTDRGAEDFTRKFNVHIEAYVNGTLVDSVDKTKEQDLTWYRALKAIPGLVYRQDQCPFLISDTSHYPMIKPQTSSP